MKLLTVNSAKIMFFVAFGLKLCLFVILFSTDIDIFGVGADSDYYHGYAIGEYKYAVNLWPIILRKLNDIYLYDRFFVSVLLFMLASISIPILVGRIVMDDWFLTNRKRQLLYWNSLLVLSLYPSLFYFSTDIFRDVLMVYLFVVSIYFVKKSISSKSHIHKAYFSVITLGISTLVFFLRPYLGISIALSTLMYPLVRIRKKNIYLYIILYLVLLATTYEMGFLDLLIQYRDGFESVTGGSTLGISLQGKSVLEFFFLFFVSFSAQILGLFFPNFSSILVFFMESLPFLLAFRFIGRNRHLLSRFCCFLIVFFVVYTTVWVIGNDNIGTAVRLRIYSYLAILVVFVRVYIVKNFGRKLLIK